MRVADYIISRLYDEGIHHIFMVTGRGALFLTDAVAANKDIKSICVHHEQSAAYAAVAYGQYNNNFGACLVSTGCAGTNAITGVLNAWQDGIPCVFISGQNKLNETSRFTGIPLRTYGQQEADIIPIISSITKYAVMIDEPKRIGYELDKALYLSKTGRKGPVWIDVPLDVQDMRINQTELARYNSSKDEIIYPEQSDLNYFINQIESSKRPVLLIGSGISSSGAKEELDKFIKKTNIPLTYSSSAVDTYSSENPLSIGSIGAMGCSRAGNFAVQNSDLLIVLGNRLTSMTTGESCKFAREAKVIIVDIDKIEHSKKNVEYEKLILSDLKFFLGSVLKHKLKKTDNKWVKKCMHWKEIFPKYEDSFKSTDKIDLYHLADSLSSQLPDECVIVTDSGLIELIIPNNLDFQKNRRIVHPASQGSMGFALPAIIGAHYASNIPIIAVIGDGSIMMNLQELETISYNEIPAKIFVINNNVYSVIRKRQKEMFRSRTIGTDPSDGVGCPDFEKVANAFNFNYIIIKNSQGLDEKIKSVFETEGPVLCEIMGKENQNYIHSSYIRNKHKKIVTRPIEDQSPFLDRELFLSEMVIDSIDQ
jgi:acetolactate synthase I/II/III large subunit